MDGTNEVPNQEIIDATQNAVLNAVDNVAMTVSEKVHDEHSHHGESLLQSAEFWVAISFVVVVIGLYRPVVKMLHRMLRKRGAMIARRIESASKTYSQAQAMLIEYEKKARNANKEAKEILAKAEREVAILKNEKLAKLEAEMNNKEREAKERIAAAKDSADKELLSKTVDVTIGLVRKALSDNIDVAQCTKSIDASIAEVANLKL